jgi:2,4-dienoyl-CoA reductase-like NADH-dependent reductase (Old Yellow Enzyme family)
MVTGLASLLEPVTLGPVTLANRIFVAPHTTNFGHPGENLVTDRHIAYHRARAEGGAGLVITEGIRVHPTSLRRLGLHAFDDSAVEGLARLAHAVHSAGAALFAQLLHTGRHSADPRIGAWGASAIPWTTGAEVPHAMNRFDLAVAVNAFADAAQRVVDSGFDGIEVHLGHGHLLQQFLSPVTNRRTDAYGGSATRRLRLAREVLAAVSTALDGRIALGLRISGDEFLEGGLTPADVEVAVRELDSEFGLDFVHVSHSAYIGGPSLATQVADMSFPPAPFRALPAYFKRAFPHLPVLAVCRLDDLATAASLVDAGEADLVGFARAHIADPAFTAKTVGTTSGRPRSCIACNQGCIANLESVTPITCTVNPETGMEDEWQQAWATSAHRQAVLVVGGGPAGMEAAATAARRGHNVELWESSDRLGGRLRDVVLMQHRERFGVLLSELESELRETGASVECGHDARAADIAASGFNTVVLATGAKPAMPLAFGDIRSFTSVEALVDPGELGERIVIYDELGTWEGAGLAEHLAARGCGVELLSPIASWAGRVTMYSRLAMGERLAAARVRVRVLCRPVRSDGSTLIVAPTTGGPEEALQSVSAFVHVQPAQACDELVGELVDAGWSGELRLAGDAYAPRSCLEAVYEGRLAGVAIGVDDRQHLRPLLARDPYSLDGELAA